jgi:hypothetical protein
MALHPNWLARYGTDLEYLPNDAAARRAGVLVDLASAGVVVGCQGVRQPLQWLVKQGAVADAQRLWRAQCGGGPALLNDPRFASASLTEVASPFDWEIGGSADIDLTFSAESGPRQLEVRGPARFTQRIASQLLVLAPGRYRLGWKSAAGGGIEAELGCRLEAASPLAARYAPASGRWQAELTIDNACAGRWLVFSLRPGVATDSLGDISLDRLPPP